MSHAFQITKEFEYAASPDQIWDAVATGPGIDAWFMGHSEVEPKDGGAVRFTLGEFTSVGTITAWQPQVRFTYGSDEMSFDYVIAKAANGHTILRLTQSGVLGDNWEAEYEALEKGWNLYLHTIDEYTTHFPGRTATTIDAMGAQAENADKAWEILTTALGIDAPGVGDHVHLPVADVDGVIDYVEPLAAIGVRTEDGLYRFSGRFGFMGVGHHVFADIDRPAVQHSWQTWLTERYA